MTDVNKVILVGRLRSDPELCQSRARFTLTTRAGHDTQLHRVTVAGEQAEDCVRKLAKGRMCLVEGRVTYRRSGGVYHADIEAERVHFLGSERVVELRPPRYDEVYEQGIDWLNQLD